MRSLNTAKLGLVLITIFVALAAASHARADQVAVHRTARRDLARGDDHAESADDPNQPTRRVTRRRIQPAVRAHDPPADRRDTARVE